MNERIRELAEQSGFHPELNWDHTDWLSAGHSPLFEKFAELIVREAIDTVLDCSIEYTTRPQIAQELKEHFGVE